MAKPVLGKSDSSDWFFLAWDFTALDCFHGNDPSHDFFCFGAKAAKSKFATKTIIRNRVPYNQKY